MTNPNRVIDTFGPTTTTPAATVALETLEVPGTSPYASAAVNVAFAPAGRNAA